MDVTPILYTALAGAAGGLGYSYYNKLVTVATYLQAAEHVGAGAIAALLMVFTGVFGAPSDYASSVPLLITGYAGTDVIDSFLAKLKPAVAPSPPAP